HVATSRFPLVFLFLSRRQGPLGPLQSKRSIDLKAIMAIAWSRFFYQLSRSSQLQKCKELTLERIRPLGSSRVTLTICRHSASLKSRQSRALGEPPARHHRSCRMKIAELRERVRIAREHEDSDRALRQWLEQKLPKLHRTIRIREDAATTLFNFVQAYIERVPDMLEAAQSVANHAKMRPQLIPVLKVAEEFFLQPGEDPELDRGMLVLLDEAYLAHRLVEEVNDRYVAH